MMLLKPDHPRCIDGVIDYFGSPAAGKTSRVAAPGSGREGALAREGARVPRRGLEQGPSRHFLVKRG